MSLHGHPLVDTVRLPDGREATVRIGLGQDSYVSERDLDTVVLEVRVGQGVVAVIDTILRPPQVSEARHLLARVRDGLGSGALSPSVSSLEPLADSIL